MTYPSSDVSRTNLDAGTDSPQLARADLDDLAAKFNLLRNHISAYMQGLIDDPDAATARATLGLIIGSNVPSPTGSGASGTWGISVTGNAATASNGGVTSVNGMTGAVSVTAGVSSLNGQTGAITTTSQNDIGSVEALLYASLNQAVVVGTAYAGSGLRRGALNSSSNPFDYAASLSGTACSGTWRCLVNAGPPSGGYAIGLFVRIS